MNSIKTIISMIESKAIDDGLKFRNQINAEAQCKVGSEVMREKEYSEWLSKQGFNVLLHANCCKIAFNSGWESRQTEVDELKLQVAEMKSRLNDAYTDGQSAMYAARQSKVDELQNDVSIMLASHKRISVELLQQQDKIENLIKERDELQKRVDAVNLVLEDLKNANYMHSGNKAYNSLLIEKLEQALKGGEDE